MDLELDEETLAFAAEVRDFLSANAESIPTKSYDNAEGFAQHRHWDKVLFDAGLSVINWPKKYGGRDAPLLHWVVFEEEYFRAGAPGRASANGTSMLAPTLFAHGTDEQLDRILPKMASGEQIWAQAWSEPESGSDLASLRSTAAKTEGGWLLNGQKIWSSRAPFAEMGFGLFRSDPAAERHNGLTYFMFDLKAKGVTVRPIVQLGGDTGFGEIFLDDVFVPDEDVIGTPNDGWRAAMSTSSNERGMSLRSPARFLAAAERLVQLWKDSGSPDALADRVADAWIKAQAYRLQTFGTVTRLAAGGELGAESSVTKVFWSDLDVAIHQTALDVRGADGELAGPWTDGLLFALGGPIYAGTNEIQRNIISERLLGLPREKSGRQEVKFALDEQQRDFAASIDAALGAADLPGALRAWSDGDIAPGRKVWEQLANLGVTALVVPEKFDGLDAHPVDLVVALERLGRWCVPGPVAESIAVAPVLLAGDERSAELSSGELIATVALPPHTPRAVDAEAAGLVLLAGDKGVSEATAGESHRSVDPSRRLYDVAASGEAWQADIKRAYEFGALATAAQLVGAAEALLNDTVEYAKQRSQFGRVIGSYQAIKHKLADVHIAIELARPLVYGAALALADDTSAAARDVSAAKAAASDAGLLAARSALQTHGAIGFTQEHDLSLWLLRVQALRSAWGTPEAHRRRVLEAL